MLSEEDIVLLTSEWSDEHRRSLFRVRDHSVASITSQPFQRPINIDSGSESDYPRLCDACKSILSTVSSMLDEAMESGQMGAHHIALDYTLYDVQVSAVSGCHLCAVFEASTLRYIKNAKPSAFEFEAERPEDSWLWLTTNARRMDNVQCDLKMGMINSEVLSDTASELSFTRRKRTCIAPPTGQSTQVALTSYTGDKVTLDIVSGWLKTCLESHDRCKVVRSAEPNVPRRLLQLGETTACVVENSQQFTYVCLSHRWGNQADVPHKLTQAGQNEPFLISNLPKTFRDAIHVTKFLGYSYLWIDCYCIVQGSEEDWIEQSAVMAQIYAHSVFTIAALAAEDTHAGCFQSRNPLALQKLQTEDFTVEPRIKHSLWRLEVEGSEPEASPLHTRAWVVQERLSAPRTIFFGRLGVYWECRCMQASEDHIQPVEDITENFKTMLGNLQAAATESAVQGSHAQASEFFHRWKALIEIYTVCALTFFSDKLIALSGITRDIEKYSGREYIQGLWKDDMAAGLLWFHNYSNSGISREDNSGRVVNSGFPTWSWASMLGKIQCFPPPGKVIWEPPISVLPNSHGLKLKVTTWKRRVIVDEDNYLTLIDDGSRRGDLDETYQWYHDEKKPQCVEVDILLLQRVSISDKPFLAAVRCLVVTNVGETVYRRLGITIIRFNTPRDDPFPSQEPVMGEDDFVLV